jgi:peptide/nickel transport system permease protein
MLTYIIRRLLYAVPIIIGVNVLTAVLFFYVNTPEDMARKILGDKNVTPAAIENWKEDHGYNLPTFINTKEGGVQTITQTVFFQKSVPLLWLDFGKSDRNNIDISSEIRNRMWASLAISVPMFMAGLVINLFLAMMLAYYRATYIDLWGVVLAVVLMSVSTLFYIIGGQFMLGKLLKLLDSLKFLVLPVVIGVAASIGSGVRFYRTVFLEEINKDYIRTARAKGLTEGKVLFKHAMKNAMIPVLTNVVVSIPFLFYGSLILETFFAIPGLGNFTIDAIQSQDFAIVRSMVYLGSILYISGLILTDISYTLVDPRVRFE